MNNNFYVVLISLFTIGCFALSVVLIIRFISLIKRKYYKDDSETVVFLDFVPNIKNKLLKSIINYVFLNVMVFLVVVRMYNGLHFINDFRFFFILVLSITTIYLISFFLAKRANVLWFRKIKINIYLELSLLLIGLILIIYFFNEVFHWFELNYQT